MIVSAQTKLGALPIDQRAAIPPFPVCQFTVDEYHRMIAAGILGEDDRVELLKGWIVPLIPQNTPHKIAVPLAQLANTAALPPGWFPNVQQPVGIADSESEPQPDLAVVRGSPRDYEDGTPRFPNVGLLIEISDSSLIEDRDIKGPLYAEACFPIYWIINLQDRIVEVYTDPTGPQDDPEYRQRRDYGIGDAVPLILDGVEMGRIAVSDLMP
jgi:Uma2 family endonuclease